MLKNIIFYIVIIIMGWFLYLFSKKVDANIEAVMFLWLFYLIAKAIIAKD